MKQIAILWVLALAGCANEGSVPINNPVGEAAYVAKIAEVEDCRIYRINDGLYTRYFSRCGEVSGDEGCGKSCTRDSSIQQMR